MSLKTILISAVGAVAGVIIGLIIGANIGGNWFTSTTIGSLHGYEATSMLGAVIGGVALGLGTFWLTLHRG